MPHSPFTARLTGLTAALCLALGLSAARAAQVEVYGLVDMGFALDRASGDGPNAKDGDVNFSMKSGMRNSSRVGLRGTEDLANGWKVRFTLENQFKADSGDLQNGGTLWERESSIALIGPYGKFTFGRVGMLKSPVGTTGLCTTGNVNPFGNSMSSFIAGHKTMTSGTYFPISNAITYASPSMSGLELFLQYSLGNDDDSGEWDDNDRYMAAAARYTRGPFKATVILDTIDRANSSAHNEQPTTMTAAVNYDFGWLKPYLYVQYFHSAPLNSIGADANARYMTASGDYDGVGGMLTLQKPIGNGRAKIGFGYMTAERSRDEAKNDVTRASIAVGYDYTFTKTLHLYTNLGYVQQETETDASRETLRGTEWVCGVVKYF